MRIVWFKHKCMDIPYTRGPRQNLERVVVAHLKYFWVYSGSNRTLSQDGCAVVRMRTVYLLNATYSVVDKCSITKLIIFSSFLQQFTCMHIIFTSTKTIHFGAPVTLFLPH
jgi:hypothetical protein